MIQLLKTNMGRLRILGFLEGITLLILIFVAVPLKYYYNKPSLSKTLGPIHGAIFVLFLVYTFIVGKEQNWKFKNTIWKIIVACFIPFGTFYIDNKIFKQVKDVKQG